MNSQTIKTLSKFSPNIKSINISNSNIKGLLDLSNFTELNDLDCSDNQIIQILVPSSLKYLNCANNQISVLTNLPDGLKCINCKSNPIIEMYYPFDICPIKFSKKLSKIVFNNYFDSHLTKIFIKSKLIYLEFGWCFNKPIDGLLPNTLKYLILGRDFSQPIDELPGNLLHLILGRDFSHPLNNLPNSLKYLKLGLEFNKPIFRPPYKISHIKINRKKQSPLDNLPESLEIIEIDKQNKYILNLLPLTNTNIKIDFYDE